MTDQAYDVRKCVFFFSESSGYHVYVHQGKRGKWRWYVRDVNTDVMKCLSPVLGHDTEGQATENASDFFNNLGVDLRPLENGE